MTIPNGDRKMTFQVYPPIKKGQFVTYTTIGGEYMCGFVEGISHGAAIFRNVHNGRYYKAMIADIEQQQREHQL